MSLRQVDHSVWVNSKQVTGVWVGGATRPEGVVHFVRLGLAGGGIRTVGQHADYNDAQLHAAHVLRVLNRRWWQRRTYWEFLSPSYLATANPLG